MRLKVVEVPGDLLVRIQYAEQLPAARTSLWFRVIAREKQSNKDGTGIKSVDFQFRDDQSNPVYARTENNAAYCAFGGDDPNCPPWVFAERGNKWPNGQPIKSGRYTLHVVVTSKAEAVQQNDDSDVSFQIQL